MKLHHSRQRALLLLCLVLLPLTKAWATGHIDSIHVLEGVVVTERLIPKDVIPAQVLGGRDLQRLSAVSVADALRYFAGVQIKDYGGIGGLKTVNVRSMGSQHVGVFYDGLQLGNAQNGQIDLGRFSLDNMETVSIYNGQRSTILQPAKSFSSAAALYMTTRRPTLPIVDPRYDLVRSTYGARTLGTWTDLNGRWAVPGHTYGQSIMQLFRDILRQ